MGRRIFVTGGSGVIGRPLVAEIERRADLECTALSRTERPAGARVSWVRGELLEPAAWIERLRGCDAVLHLGAATGRAPRAEFERTNATGTQRLLDACKEAGVRRFVHVSTIAVVYPEKRAYPYAASKERAEALVRASGLDWTLVRPAIVLGQGSPTGRLLVSLARLPATPVLGSGRVRIQPVLSDDVASALLAWTFDPATVGQEIELGGPEALSFEELLRKLRRALGRSAGPIVHLPLRPVIWTLAQIEKLLPPLFVSAGQLYSFRYDSVARPNRFADARRATMTGVDPMLALLAREFA
jgi:NADH dehydrogenase